MIYLLSLCLSARFQLCMSNDTHEQENRTMSTMHRTNANPEADPNGPLDVWLRFESPEDEEASHEANTYRNEDGTYRVEWYHNSVGFVKTAKFSTYAAATAWLESHGYQDFTVTED